MFNGKGYPQLTSEVTEALEAQGVRGEVANSMLALACGFLTKGCGEKVHAHGCRIVIVNQAARLLHHAGRRYTSAELGLPPWYNKYGGDTKPNVLRMEGQDTRFVQQDFVSFGGFIGLDGQSGDFIVTHVVPRDDLRAAAGTYGGVEIESRDDCEALALAARGGCMVISCPPEHCEISGASGGSLRVFYRPGGPGAVEGVRVIEIPTKKPSERHRVGGGGEGGLGAVEAERGGAAAAEEEEEDAPDLASASATLGRPRTATLSRAQSVIAGHTFDIEQMVVRYTEVKLPKCFDNEAEVQVSKGRTKSELKRFDGRSVVDATIRLMAWFSRMGVPLHTDGRPFCCESAKGALVIITDGDHVDKFCEIPKFNKYEHMNKTKNWKGIAAPVNVLTIFEDANEEALRQVALDFLIDGAMIVDIHPDRFGWIIASGVTVLDLSHGSRNGGKKTQAASSAARGNNADPETVSLAIKLSEDDCDVDLDPSLIKYLQVFNGELIDETTERVEPAKIPIRCPRAPAVTASEYIRLAKSGHVLGVRAFLEANEGRVDEPRDGEEVRSWGVGRGGGGGGGERRPRRSRRVAQSTFILSHAPPDHIMFSRMTARGGHVVRRNQGPNRNRRATLERWGGRQPKRLRWEYGLNGKRYSRCVFSHATINV